MKRVRKGPAEAFAGFFILTAWVHSARDRGRVLRLFRTAGFWLAIVLLSACAGRADRLPANAPPGSAAAEAVPTISSVQPSEAKPGSKLTVKIAGGNFLSGAYVSFSDPAIHVLSTRRASETELDVEIAVGQMAKPQSVLLYVSNPSGASAKTAFAITTAGPAATAPQQSQTQSRTVSAPGPVVTKIDPSQAAVGTKQNVKVTGKNFKEGAKIAFSNPGIRVLGTEFKKPTELIAQIEIASNAPTGRTSLFVVNPDENEVEAGFEVTGGNSAQAGAATGKTASEANTPTKQWSVYNLGDATSILQNPGKAKGQLVVKGGKLAYDQDGKVVFTAQPSDIQEIAPNVFFGINTGTFHIILNSGKRYNFVSSSLTPADTNSIIESLRSALK